MSFKKFYTEGAYGYDNIKSIGTTTEGGLYETHTHTYQVDQDGNGFTSNDFGHIHEVTNFVVKSEHQHIHLLEKMD